MVAPVRFFDEIIDFLTSAPTPQEIVAYRPSSALQQRAEELTEKSKTGALSEPDQKELDYFLVIEHLMRMAKIRARQRLAEA
ncbi:MAG: hypothetical protein ABIQ93_07680 [Saprospiraceae bacterium]